MRDTPEVKEDGPWAVVEARRYTGYLEVYLQSDDFHHDAAMRITGDFGGEDNKRVYAQLICDRLNNARELEREVAALRKALTDAKGTIDSLLDELGVPREHSTTVDAAYDTLEAIDAAIASARLSRPESDPK